MCAVINDVLLGWSCVEINWAQDLICGVRGCRRREREREREEGRERGREKPPNEAGWCTAKGGLVFVRVPLRGYVCVCVCVCLCVCVCVCLIVSDTVLVCGV